MTITSNQLIKTLALFKCENQMTDFIDCLSQSPDVCIQVNRKRIQQGSAANFLHAYTEHGLYPDELDESKQAAIILHFSHLRFKKTQLVYLLKNLQDNAIKHFLLATQCFHERELSEFVMSTHL